MRLTYAIEACTALDSAAPVQSIACISVECYLQLPAFAFVPACFVLENFVLACVPQCPGCVHMPPGTLQGAPLSLLFTVQLHLVSLSMWHAHSGCSTGGVNGCPAMLGRRRERIHIVGKSAANIR